MTQPRVVPATSTASESFPRFQARSRRFRLGAPRSAHPIGDGSRALFLRSSGPTDPVTALWISDLTAEQAGQPVERIVADPRVLLSEEDEHEVPAAELARRERSREQAGGIVAYAVDQLGTRVVFALAGSLWAVDLAAAGAAADDTSGDPAVRVIDSPGPVIDPSISPDGRLVAYSTGPSVVLVDLASGDASTLAQSTKADVSWGLADFIAGEEMDRYHGIWWSPTSDVLLVQRTDESDEPLWNISDPAHPEGEPVARRYPQALSRNARVDLYAFAATVQSRQTEGVRVEWDHDRYEYLAAVHWSAGGPPLALVQSRAQTDDAVLAIDPGAGTVRALASHHQRHWLDIVPGTPAWTPGGRLVTVDIDEQADTSRLALDGVPVSAPGLQVREVLAATGDGILVRASRDPRSVDVLWVHENGSERTLSAEPGVHTAMIGGSGSCLVSATLDERRTRTVHRWNGVEHELGNASLDPGFDPQVAFHTVGEHALRAAVITPSPSSPCHDAASLPVLVRPYGGPGFQRVLFAQAQYREDQWWADQGFLVLVVDGRGTPGRGPAWERAIDEAFASVTLADQIEAIRSLPAIARQADLSRVAIAGWSYGGYLSALAVLRAPETFHAAVAGAPPTDWTLYDTHYTERYLGLDPDVYRTNSLIDDAPALRRPLLLVHGLADDNVTVANTLRLSAALLAAGRPHSVLPLSGVTHMTTDETVAENLLLLQLEFLRRALNSGAVSAAHDEATARDERNAS